MYSQYSIVNGFQSIRVETLAKDFMKMFDSLVDYDDGQGRNYDILDEEIYE